MGSVLHGFWKLLCFELLWIHLSWRVVFGIVFESEVDMDGDEIALPKEYECVDYYYECEKYNQARDFERDKAWFSLNCAETFGTCQYLNYTYRCNYDTLNISSESIYQPGDMDSVFDNIISKYSQQYHITVHSSSPWVITLDNFLSNDETNAFINVIERIKDQERRQREDPDYVERMKSNLPPLPIGGEQNAPVSFTAWCMKQCMDEYSIIRSTYRRMAELVSVPDDYFEHFLFVKYGIGNGFPAHHDYHEDDIYRMSGPRILTFFLFFSDVSDGGEREFVDLDIRIQPKRGRALLWVNTLSSFPDRIDNRTAHQDLPLRTNLQFKYGANIAVFLRNYHVPYDWKCSVAGS